jgi:hypothetical protein
MADPAVAAVVDAVGGTAAQPERHTAITAAFNAAILYMICLTPFWLFLSGNFPVNPKKP